MFLPILRDEEPIIAFFSWLLNQVILPPIRDTFIREPSCCCILPVKICQFFMKDHPIHQCNFLRYLFRFSSVNTLLFYDMLFTTSPKVFADLPRLRVLWRCNQQWNYGNLPWGPLFKRGNINSSPPPLDVTSVCLTCDVSSPKWHIKIVLNNIPYVFLITATHVRFM